MSGNVGQDIYGQIISAWHFLHIGLFLDNYMKGQNVQPSEGFLFNGYNFEASAIRTAWPTEFPGKSGESYFGSHVFYLSSREILSGIAEGISSETIDNDSILVFRTFIEDRLQEQFAPYNQIIRFCRNVLSHNIAGDLTLTGNDFEGQKDFLIRSEQPLKIELSVNYCDVFGQTYSHQGHFDIAIDFDLVNAGTSFFEYVTPEQLMQLVIFSGSLAESYLNKRAKLHLEENIAASAAIGSDGVT